MGPIARHTGTLHPYGAEEANRQPAPAFSSTEDDVGIPLHPGAKSLFDHAPVLRRIPIFGETCEAYGPSCTISLGLSYLLCKGLSFGFLKGSIFPIFINVYKLEASRYQRLIGLMGLSFTIKAFTAVICDTFAFFGYTKRWYMFASCVVGSVFALLYALLPAKQSSGNIAAGFVFLSSYGVANVDVLSEGHYSRLMRKIPKAGPSLVSWVWWFISSGGTVAVMIMGPLSDLNMPHVGVFIAAGLQFLSSLIHIFNLYGEKMNREERIEDARITHKELLLELEKGKAPSRTEGKQDGLNVDQGKPPQLLEPICDGETVALADDLPMNLTHTNQQQAQKLKEHAGTYQDEASPELLLPQPIICCCGLIDINKEVAMRNKRVVAYCFVVTGAVIILGFGNVFASTLGFLIICVVVSLVCSVMSFWALPYVIAKVNVFNYLTSAVCIGLPGIGKFYIAGPDCVPGGPHFSLTFMYTVCTIISTVSGLTGILVFKYFFSKSNYRKIMIITTVILVPFVLPEVIMLKRWNIQIGIPDHLFYIGTSTIISPLIAMISWMPSILLLSRLCPRGSESMVYALLASFLNFGGTTSTSIGAILMEYVWPIKSNPPCNFKNAVKLVIVGYILSPLLIIPLTLLLPNVRLSDEIDVNGNVVSKKTDEEPHVKPAKDSNEVH
ncbi:unnamed protein product [Phytomonas sp. Hart1]|nr:unnamed protein product [Phytomonas sp. Hart1]|eukprot:CCW72069.1 unnamed protein product [Phytomonas sp. isolate Hart1]